MLTDLYRQRALIGAFANRDFATRYRSSILGSAMVKARRTRPSCSPAW